MSAIRECILAAHDLRREAMDVPEWGVTIDARELSGLDRQRFFALVSPGDGEKVDILRYHSAAVVLGACEPGGGPIFLQGDDEIEGEILEVSRKSIKAVFTIAAKVLDLSGIGKKAEERIEKNSGGDAPDE